MELSLLSTPKIVEVRDLSRPADSEISDIIAQCRKSNMALYEVQNTKSSGTADAQKRLRSALNIFCSSLGLNKAEVHRSQGDDGVVALEVDDLGIGSGYIPYTNKALSWHTDGYYNAPDARIKAMVLHCARDASEGGVNELLDPEIAYIRLRDANPAFINALMHEEAMIIPENTDKRSAYRSISVGPVFFLDEVSGALNMRYSARGRNIIWRDGKNTDMARAMLGDILSNDPFVVRHKLKPGQGVISNNVLHNRTGFTNEANGHDSASTRLMYRIRYMDRIGEQSIN